MDPLKKLSVNNIEENQLSLLSFSLIFSMILQVKILYASKIIFWNLGKLNLILIMLCFLST